MANDGDVTVTVLSLLLNKGVTVVKPKPNLQFSLKEIKMIHLLAILSVGDIPNTQIISP